MFSLHDIDEQVAIMEGAAVVLEEKAAEAQHIPTQMGFFGAATGFRDAAGSLKRMIERHIEAEAREALR